MSKRASFILLWSGLAVYVLILWLSCSTNTFRIIGDP